MSITTLTPQQLAEIVFQRPGRLTAGVLEKRSVGEKLRDRFLIYRDKSNLCNMHSNPFERMREKIFLEFNEQAGALTEHPRSLRQAALELQAVGFSHAQIKEIKNWVYRFNLVYLERTILAAEVEKDFPGFCNANDDRAFLGTTIQSSPGRSAILISEADLGPVNNSAYTERTEPLAFKLFTEKYLPRMEKEHPNLFTPAKRSPRLG